MIGNEKLENLACTPAPLDPARFNSRARLPYGCTVDHIRLAMQDFLGFLGTINGQIGAYGIPRLETMLMQANFSSVVGEFMKTTIPKHCKTLATNRYHNGHPDLVPSGIFINNAVQHSHQGIEVKASRYLKSWQGHNPENIWLLVFAFDCNRPNDSIEALPPKPFRFLKVVGAQLEESDWKFAGRSETSRRTITASVTNTGYDKMMDNWIYNTP